jgi:hypothetical protein
MTKFIIFLIRLFVKTEGKSTLTLEEIRNKAVSEGYKIALFARGLLFVEKDGRISAIKYPNEHLY